jgi:hypothetical protein
MALGLLSARARRWSQDGWMMPRRKAGIILPGVP